MKILSFAVRGEEMHRHHNDVERIMEACASAGYLIGYQDAVRAWEEFSSTYAAGWMHLPEEACKIVSIVTSYCNEFDN